MQALIKSGLSVTGKRIVIAGTGPLLLAVAAYAKRKGAIVACVAEQTSWAKLAGFGATALLSAQKSTQTLSLLWQMRGIPYWKKAWPVAALGTTAVEAARITREGKQTEIACDYLACGFHLVPSTELAQLAGCRLNNSFVAVDEFQQTSMHDVFCAGESTGIGGVEKSLIEGQIAGFASTGRLDRARDLVAARAGVHSHVNSMKRAFALREELRSLPQNDTLVCRCEDVPFGRLRQHTSWRDAKLQTRCGMGPCQGKICGAAAEFLFGWDTGSVRPPALPVSCASLAAFSADAKSQSTQGGLQ
jgi:NADPH-dependent 2,4-dienoyl-CoA reductase/sulfur reductase-like enzyme